MREKGTHDYGASVLEDEEHAALRGYAVRVREDVMEGDAYGLRSLVGWTLLCFALLCLLACSREKRQRRDLKSALWERNWGVTEVLGYVRAALALLRRDGRCPHAGVA